MRDVRRERGKSAAGEETNGRFCCFSSEKRLWVIWMWRRAVKSSCTHSALILLSCCLGTVLRSIYITVPVPTPPREALDLLVTLQVTTIVKEAKSGNWFPDTPALLCYSRCPGLIWHFCLILCCHNIRRPRVQPNPTPTDKCLTFLTSQVRVTHCANQ